jgi:hypothetical protein
MLRLLRYVMRVFYANENYAKYGVPGMNYFMALMGAAFYIMITGFTILMVLSASSPKFYGYLQGLHTGIPGILQAIILLGTTYLILRLSFKEETLKCESFTKEKTNRAVNYLLLYAFASAIFIGFLGLRYLRSYH